MSLISTVHGLESGRKKAADGYVHPYRAILERLLAEKSDQILVLSSMMKSDCKRRFRFLLSKSGSFHIRA
ncbi:hypothetical protein B4090_2864 [Bacillus licheniformis]|nr:hypothetical protein B4090_2864 [Bacillus licheniformis]